MNQPICHALPSRLFSFSMSRLLLAVGAVVLLAAHRGAAAAEGRAAVLAPASERFAESEVSETPDFQKHLIPLLGKIGCNGRACHGSFQGRGGFQLSLFGYDFDMDRKNLFDRLETTAPADSYLLQKPTLAEPHEGGKLLTPDTWQYRLFLNWIAGGAQGVEEAKKIAVLEITPSEIQFTQAGQKQQLQAIAVWEDGSREDVTCLCRFKSNDDAICKIDGEGQVTAVDPGDSHVVVFYDNAVVAVPVMQPVGDPAQATLAQQPGRTPIDEFVLQKLRKLGIEPSGICTDSDFLRRVSLDMTGTLPTADEVRWFLSDRSPEKRARKIDELLQTRAYAAWWTTRLCDWTGNSDSSLNNVNPTAPQQGSIDWYNWIFHRVKGNLAYDQICEQIVLASGRRPDEDYRSYCQRLSNYSRNENGTYADEPGLMYFWGRRNFTTSEDRAVGFAYTFMGTRIQCAQCHKHPFDVWTQQDFKEFERFFDNVRFARTGRNRAETTAMVKELGLDDLKGNELRRALDRAAADGKTIPFPEIVVTRPRAKRVKSGGVVAPNFNVARLLGEDEVNLNQLQDPRLALMNWLRNSPTKLFARSFVNRVWSNYFNRGIVEPTDDLSLANPPVNGPLLDYLADGFIAHHYDMHWLHREICLSDTYQRDWKTTPSNQSDERNFSRSVPRRLPAEVAYDALVMATANDATGKAFRENEQGHATTNPSPPRGPANRMDYSLAVFGRSTRDSNCDCDRSSEASLLQTIFVRNDFETLQMIDGAKSWFRTVEQKLGRPSGPSPEALAQQQAQLEKQIQRATKKKPEQVPALKRRLAVLERQMGQKAPVTPVNLDGKARRELIDEAYLRTLSRFPNPAERDTSLGHLKSSEDPLDGLKDLLWALVNTKEFMLNH